MTIANENPTVAQIKALFGQVQQLAGNKGSIKEARALTSKIARLVKQVALSDANTQDRADAVNWLEYAMLALSRLSRRKDVQTKLRTEAYAIGAQAIALRLLGKRDRGVAFAAYNLGIDLVITEHRPAEAIGYLRTSRTILKHVPKEQIPRDFRLNLNRGIAQCEYDLGNRDKAARILRGTMGKNRPKLSNWGELRGFAHCQELLAQILLDNLAAKRAS
jgi:hypothetical protein